MIKSKSKRNKVIYLNEEFQKEISQKTGFDKNKIDLRISKRTNSEKIDYHEFEYEGKIYILKKDKLKTKERK